MTSPEAVVSNHFTGKRCNLSYSSTRTRWVSFNSRALLNQVRSVNRNWRSAIAPIPSAAVERMRSGRFWPMMTSMNRMVIPGNTSTNEVHNTAIDSDNAL